MDGSGSGAMMNTHIFVKGGSKKGQRDAISWRIHYNLVVDQRHAGDVLNYTRDYSYRCYNLGSQLARFLQGSKVYF